MVRLHAIFTPPEPTVYDHLRNLIDTAEQAEDDNHPVEALIELGNVKAHLTSYLVGRAS